MLRDTGGVVVEYAGASTWGHLDAAAEARFADGVGELGGGLTPRSQVLSVASGALSLEVGAVLVVDGAQRTVRTFRPSEDGGLTRVLLADRTHLVEVYRRGSAVNARGRRTGAWEQVAGIADPLPANIEARSGALDEGPAAVDAVARWFAYLARPAVPVEEGDGIRVVDGFGPPRFIVQFVADHGPGADLVLQLETTDEEFGA